jgi:hypothetical protein
VMVSWLRLRIPVSDNFLVDPNLVEAADLR